jgi:hypothetical protein
MLIGLMIRCYRKKQNIPVRKLAKTIGIDHAILWRFESGKSVNVKAWVKIVKWMLTE